jgi:endoglucanase
MAPREPWNDASPRSVERGWVQAWTILSRHHAAAPPGRPFFELANEPGLSDGERWAGMQKALRRAVRAQAPAHPLPLTANPTSTPAALAALPLGTDGNVAYVFHLYQAMVFTHQGAGWPGASEYQGFAGLDNVPNAEYIARVAAHSDPARLEQYARIGGQMVAREADAVAAWAGAHHAAVSATEFGVFRRAPPASRAAWLGEARHRLQAASFGWRLWEYEGGFGIEPELARV